jgi:hypothetical protein
MRRFPISLPAAGRLAALVLALSLPSCVAAVAAGAAAGVVGYKALLDEDTYTLVLPTNADRVFGTAREVMRNLDPESIADPSERKVEGTWDRASITAQVEYLSNRESRLVVRGRRYELAAQGAAKEIAERIAQNLNAVARG